jgi:eukaryotic-like serine/threonine-protein kinase
MELLQGTTLRQRLASGPLGVSESLHVMRGVCAALTAAHDQGLVHRDLKPENIFLQQHTSGVVPKILDFGLAKAFDAERRPAVGSSAGLLVGTLDYMSPEQVAGHDVSPEWDVWALGVIAYEMLTGVHPFRAVVFGGSVSTQGISAGALHHATLTEPANALFAAALSTDRARRPSSPGDFLAGCEQVLA